MMPFEVTIGMATEPALGPVLAPVGMATPHGRVVSTHVDGGSVESVQEAVTGQPALLIRPTAPKLTVRYRADGSAGVYPEAMFKPHESRYTRAADALLDEVSEIAPDAAPSARVEAIARATAERFTYGHVELEERAGYGLDHIPALGCEMRTGSCVDINTYFVAYLRAVGIDVGYVTGYFFPAEKGGTCSDQHCWVVTRTPDGGVEEWDIAHHLKLGTREIRPSLNPKPGYRVALFHSMGLDFPDLGIRELKLLGEPMWVAEGAPRPELEIRLSEPALLQAAS